MAQRLVLALAMGRESLSPPIGSVRRLVVGSPSCPGCARGMLPTTRAVRRSPPTHRAHRRSSPASAGPTHCVNQRAPPHGDLCGAPRGRRVVAPVVVMCGAVRLEVRGMMPCGVFAARRPPCVGRAAIGSAPSAVGGTRRAVCQWLPAIVRRPGAATCGRRGRRAAHHAVAGHMLCGRAMHCSSHNSPRVLRRHTGTQTLHAPATLCHVLSMCCC